MIGAEPMTDLEVVGERLRSGGIVMVSGALDNGCFMMMDASAATDAKVNFMVTEARGLLGAAVTLQWASRLGLVLQPRSNRLGYGHAYLHSVEARAAVTTGISASDRAATLRALARPAACRGDLVSPGHVFPIVAAEGGLCTYLGAAEAATDLMTRAGLPPVAAICGVLDVNGNVACAQFLENLARRHVMPVLDVPELIGAMKSSH